MLSRKPTQAVLLNATPNFVQVARLGRPDIRPLRIESPMEFDLADEAGLQAWLESEFSEEGRFISGLCAFHPKGRVLVRETLIPRRLAEPGYLASILAAHARVDAQRDWHVVALETETGEAFKADGTPRPALILGVSKADVRAFQQGLVQLRIRPRRIEVGTLPALGSVLTLHAQTGAEHALAVCEVGVDETRIYIVARNGVHIQPILPCGLRTIEEAAMKEFGCADLTAARQRLDMRDEELQRHERRLVRLFARHLRLSFDYFEHQTGQVIGAMQLLHLPRNRAWVADALGVVVDVPKITADISGWVQAAGLEIPAGNLGIDWLASLGLVADLAAAQHSGDATAA